ncbi:MAG: hypothetical protein JOY65_08255, partial [Acetobacteraceae bacterium]|nr:hypothetical protein [Acetobacteraceae bacterium]
RLCLVYHLVEVVDRAAGGTPDPLSPHEVPEAVAEKAAAMMCQIILPHWQRAERVMFNTEQAGHARWVAGYILSRGLGHIDEREVLRAYRALGTPEKSRERREVLDALTRMDWLELKDPDGSSRRTPRWRVNPRVHALFAERAARERRRREAEKARIQAAIQTANRLRKRV